MRDPETRRSDARSASWRARAVLAIVVLSLAAPAWVSAHHVDPRDPNDTRGRLDVKRVYVAGARKPRFKVVTWGRWTPREIWDQGYVMVRLDTFGTQRFDYYALVRSTGSGMRALMYRDRSGRRDRRMFRLGVWKPSRRSVTVVIRLGRLRMPERRRNYRWAVETLFTGARCRRVCFDLVPDRGAVREANPFVPEPSPTITSTITPTPTVT